MIVSATSGMTRTSRSGMPSSPRPVARNRMLASWVRPDSTSLPITSRQAVGFFAAMESFPYRKSRSSGISGLSAGGISYSVSFAARTQASVWFSRGVGMPFQRRQTNSGISRWNPS